MCRVFSYCLPNAPPDGASVGSCAASRGGLAVDVGARQMITVIIITFRKCNKKSLDRRVESSEEKKNSLYIVDRNGFYYTKSPTYFFVHLLKTIMFNLAE